MKSLPGAKYVNNCEIAIINVEKNKEITCPSSCLYCRSDYPCEIKAKIRSVQKQTFKATVISVNEKNLGYNGHFSCIAHSSNVIMVDSEGFRYDGKMMCEHLIPLRYAEECTNIPLGSQINYAVLFPALPKRLDVSKVFVRADCHEDNFLMFEVGNLTQMGEESAFGVDD